MPRKSDKVIPAQKRKYIDELELLASEAGVPFRRDEEHLELVIGGVENAVKHGAQQTAEALKELREESETRTKSLEKQLASISTALWIICGIFALAAAKMLLGY